MAQYCMICNQVTGCTDYCKDCAKEEYARLKEKTGNAEYVSEIAIRNELGDGAFKLLKEYGYIEYCTTIQGYRMYAI